MMSCTKVEELCSLVRDYVIMYCIPFFLNLKRCPLSIYNNVQVYNLLPLSSHSGVSATSVASRSMHFFHPARLPSTCERMPADAKDHRCCTLSLSLSRSLNDNHNNNKNSNYKILLWCPSLYLYSSHFYEKIQCSTPSLVTIYEEETRMDG